MKNKKLLYTMALAIGILLPSQVSPWPHIHIPACIQHIGLFIAQSMTAAKAHIPACIRSKTAKLAILATTAAGIIGSLAKKRWPHRGQQHKPNLLHQLEETTQKCARLEHQLAEAAQTRTRLEGNITRMQKQLERTQTIDALGGLEGAIASLATANKERDAARQEAQQANGKLQNITAQHELLLNEKAELLERIKSLSEREARLKRFDTTKTTYSQQKSTEDGTNTQPK